ncbi:S-adenosylmethionine-binding protein [Maritimibacter sp. 55A14]|uniref:MT-A70 family methyltransferase n=1 Tax=Maritimibacter sp. 55A14 TaxID=2174844 RepID=UPI000D61F951|nr:MT-A70 family methyltransferase [Maritimibacter sp. 55A14]PWE29982.1 S-adenosylmethionine-binding protein [Maritimibacter sp. 55A14]
MTDWPFDTLTPMKYGAILADPPWAYAMRSPKGYGKSPEAHYETMPIEAIRALPVSQLAGPDCLLFLWSTWPHLDQAMGAMAAWGFRYITGGAWIKRTPKGKLGFGGGYVLRSSSEPFLVGRIGAPQTADKAVRNVIETSEIPDHIDAIRREHSRKPPEMRDMIARLRPRSFACELFAREPWPGHDVWGFETGKFVEAAS